MQDARDVIVITDFEPDDRIALQLLVAALPRRILFVGATLLDAQLKKRLVTKALDDAGRSDIPVYAGLSRSADSYADLVSTRAARTYQPSAKEEPGELVAELISTLDHSIPRSIEVVLLAPPTELVAALDGRPDLRGKIKRVHCMGGWTADGRTSFNWSMDAEASRRLMALRDVPILLYSSHVLKRDLGTSVNRDSYPALVQVLQLSPDCREALGSWNRHVSHIIPSLAEAISNHLDEQFTPADPAVVVGLLDPSFVLRWRPVRVEIAPSDRMDGGYAVRVSDDRDSNVLLADSLDRNAFERILIENLAKR